MICRIGLSPISVGLYSEMIVGAAFVAAGARVTFPLGIQPGWDMLVSDVGSDSWYRVQVKTVTNLQGRVYPSLTLGGHNRHRSSYTAAEVDVVVALHPETGTMWKVPATVFDGRKHLLLNPEFLWHGNMEVTALPMSEVPRPLNVVRIALAQRHALLCEQRADLMAALPDLKPVWASQPSWDIALRWCKGEGYKVIARDYGVTAPAVRERIFRILCRLGLAERPPGNLTRPSVRKRPKRDDLMEEIARLRAGVAV